MALAQQMHRMYRMSSLQGERSTKDPFQHHHNQTRLHRLCSSKQIGRQLGLNPNEKASWEPGADRIVPEDQIGRQAERRRRPKTGQRPHCKREGRRWEWDQTWETSGSGAPRNHNWEHANLCEFRILREKSKVQSSVSSTPGDLKHWGALHTTSAGTSHDPTLWRDTFEP